MAPWATEGPSALRLLQLILPVCPRGMPGIRTGPAQHLYRAALVVYWRCAEVLACSGDGAYLQQCIVDGWEGRSVLGDDGSVCWVSGCFKFCVTV